MNSRMKLRHSAGDMIRSGTSTKICCSSTVKCSGATVEDVTPGYPHGGPIHSLGQGVDRADQLQTDYIRTTCYARLHEASSGVGIGSNFPCTVRDTVVAD